MLKRRYLRLASLNDRFVAQDHMTVKYFIKSVLHEMVRKNRVNLIDFDTYYKKFEMLCSVYNDQSTEKVGIFSLNASDRRFQYYRKDLEETITVPFEFVTVPIPKNYDHVLQNVYGDYLKYVKGGSIHGGMILDADYPYTAYLDGEQYRNYNRELYYHE